MSIPGTSLRCGSCHHESLNKLSVCAGTNRGGSVETKMPYIKSSKGGCNDRIKSFGENEVNSLKSLIKCIWS
jgi:hypothetical protein